MKLIASLAIAALVVLLLGYWSGVRAGDVAAALRSANLSLFAAFLGLQALVYVVRGLRLRHLMRSIEGVSPSATPSASLAIAAATAWTFDSQVLPARVGEGSLVLHLGRLGVKGSVALVALLVSRIFDLIALLTVFGAACLWGGATRADMRLDVMLPLGLILIAGALLLLAAVFRGGHVFGLVRRVLMKLGLERLPLGVRVSETAARVEAALHSVSAPDLLKTLLWTLPLTALIFGAYVALGRSAGLPPLAFTEWIFGTSCAMLGGLIPISGFLGVGAFDVAFAGGFASVGVTKEVATTSSLAFHTLYLVGVAFYGAIGHAVLSARRSPETTP